MKCPHCGLEIAEKDILPVIISTGEEFEQFLCDKINAQEGLRCEKTKASGDQGVDLIVCVADKKIAIQCKLYSDPVGNSAVQEAFTGCSFYGCTRAVVVTNSAYTESAKSLAGRIGVDLVHYQELLGYLATFRGQFDNDVEATDDFGIENLCGNERIEELAHSEDGGSLAKLACRYFSGNGVPQSQEEGLRLLDRALQKEDTPADVLATAILVQELFAIYVDLGMTVQEGLYIAAKKGSSLAERYVRSRVRGGDDNYLTVLARIERCRGNNDVARTSAQQAVDVGHVDAASVLSSIFLDASSSLCNEDEALKWLEFSVQHGDRSASETLAELYLSRLDYEGAIRCFERMEGEFSVKVIAMLEKKLFPVRSLNQDQQNRVFKLYLSTIIASRKYYKVDKDALDYLVEAASCGEVGACDFLGKMVEAGYGHLFLPTLEQALDSGYEWPRLILLEGYRRKVREPSAPYLRAISALRGIVCGATELVPLFQDLMVSDSVRLTVEGHVESSEYLRSTMRSLLKCSDN